MEADLELLEEKVVNRKAERTERQKAHHTKTVWMHFSNLFLGMWLLSCPISFGYQSNLTTVNDITCGVIIITLSLLSFNPFRYWALWGLAITGLWLNVAPLFFWAPTAVEYNNDVFVGILVIAFSFVLPGIPGLKMYEEKGPSTPPGWTYNPSSWIQRTPVIALGWIGFFAARYLTTFQLGYIDSAWDPFFEKGTENVLTSDISKAWPVSDAGLGAFSYMLDAMMGYIGGTNRWRTMPWLVILFGILIIPLGAISIMLIMLQPLAVGSWCSICLFTAIVMLFMIPVTFDEILASVQFIQKKKNEGVSAWRTFFYGGTTSEKTIEETPHDFTRSLAHTFKVMFSGLHVPWNLAITSIIGIWLMFSPYIFGYENTMADSDHFVGALVVTFSVIAMGEIVRSARFINIIFGLWVVLAPFLLEGSTEIALSNGLASGFLLILLSFRKGKIKDSYGTYDRFII